MILPAQQIRALCAHLMKPMIYPFHERKTHEPTGMTYGLGPASYDLTLDQELVIGPGKFVLASATERLSIPNMIQAKVGDKSSWARLGLQAFNTTIDPGFDGFLTLELVNHSNSVLRAARGTPIVMLEFHLLSDPTEHPYAGRYQYQPAEPVPAKVK